MLNMKQWFNEEKRISRDVESYDIKSAVNLYSQLLHMPYLILMWKKQLWGLSFQLYNVFVRIELQKITVSLNIVQAKL